MNAYGSKLDTFTGYDLYNLALPVIPPAPFTPAGLTPRYLANRQGAAGAVYGLNVSDHPYLRGLGLFCNLADGLVDINASHSSTVGISLLMRLNRFGRRLTGTIANTAGNPVLTGTGTLFTTELCVGMTITWADANGNVREGEVDIITSPTSITLTGSTSNTGMFSGANTTAGYVYPIIASASSLTLSLPTLNQVYPFDYFIGDVSKVRPLRGTFIFTSGSTTVTGRGTRFLSDVTAGQYIRYLDTAGTLRTVVVTSVTDDFTLTLPTGAPASGTFTGGLITNPASIPSLLDSHLGINVSQAGTMTWGTISLDPAYSNERVMFHVVADIEHTYDLTTVWGQ